MRRQIWAAMTVIVALVAACGGASPTPGPTSKPGIDLPPSAPPLTLSEISTTDYSDVTLDLLYHPDTTQARFVDAVYDAVPFDGPSPLTDKSMLVYALASCSDREPPFDPEWGLAPGKTRADLDRWAATVRSIAAQQLCPSL